MPAGICLRTWVHALWRTQEGTALAPPDNFPQTLMYSLLGSKYGVAISVQLVKWVFHLFSKASITRVYIFSKAKRWWEESVLDFISKTSISAKRYYPVTPWCSINHGRETSFSCSRGKVTGESVNYLFFKGQKSLIFLRKMAFLL